MIWDHGKGILEALLHASPDPLPLKTIGAVIGLDEKEARLLVEDLRAEYQGSGRGLMLREVAGGYQLVTKPEFASYVERLLTPRGKGLSHAALETLAIIAYRQPITKAEVEAVRGVNSERVVEGLCERRLVREVGRREGPGRPHLYGTTTEFLTYFGLKDLKDLPQVEPQDEGGHSLLRRMAIEEVEEAPAVGAGTVTGGDPGQSNGEG